MRLSAGLNVVNRRNQQTDRVERAGADAEPDRPMRIALEPARAEEAGDRRPDEREERDQERIFDVRIENHIGSEKDDDEIPAGDESGQPDGEEDATDRQVML